MNLYLVTYQIDSKETKEVYVVAEDYMDVEKKLKAHSYYSDKYILIIELKSGVVRFPKLIM